MKTITIVPGDNMVYVDRVARVVDCSSIDQTIHAIQFDADKGLGHIEFVDEDPHDGHREPNASITSIEPYQSLVDAWQAAGL